MLGLLARYPAMSLQVVAKIYAPGGAAEAEGRPLLPPPRGGRGGPVRDAAARAAVGAVLARTRGGQIEVIEDGRSRTFGETGTDLHATVRINDPAAWRGPLHGSVGLGEGYVDGLWETDDLVSLIQIAARSLANQHRGVSAAVARTRSALHRLRGLVPENTRGGARRQHQRPLRPRQRPLRLLPRPDDDVLLRVLPARGRRPRGGAAGEARPHLRAPRARPRHPPAGDRQRLGRDGDPRGARPPAAG